MSNKIEYHKIIVDFYCHALKLIIELDGWTHDSDKSQARDTWRQNILEKAEYKTVQVYGDIEKVLNSITVTCKARAKELWPMV